MIGRWVRMYVWPWTAIRRAYAKGFSDGVTVGAQAVAAHVRELAERQRTADAKEEEALRAWPTRS